MAAVDKMIRNNGSSHITKEHLETIPQTTLLCSSHKSFKTSFTFTHSHTCGADALLLAADKRGNASFSLSTMAVLCAELILGVLKYLSARPLVIEVYSCILDHYIHICLGRRQDKASVAKCINRIAPRRAVLHTEQQCKPSRHESRTQTQCGAKRMSLHRKFELVKTPGYRFLSPPLVYTGRVVCPHGLVQNLVSRISSSTFA